MTRPDEFAVVGRLFERAIELDGEARARFLDAACNHDTSLRAAVEALLHHDQAPHPMLARADLPDRIRGYRVLGRIGEGGMGCVYRARQSNPERDVALKVLRGRLSPERRQQLEREARVLARFQHPGIAQIYEAGVTEGGEPFFAMELVEGTTLLESGPAKSERTRDRVELLARVADAVQHAHQREVVHRDLKPANIMVTPEGAPKIVDFGIARLLDPDASQVTLSAAKGIVGTLSYMSPEQLTGDAAAIDTRCDVYALGVILYELLTRHPPYDLRGCTLAEAVRIVSEQPLPRLGDVDRRFRGDLETIVARAIDRDRERRFATAADLAEDLRRFLGNEPIRSRPPSTFYVLHKLAQRKRAWVVGLAGMLTVGVFGIVAEVRQRVRAEQEWAKSQAVVEFLQGVFQAPRHVGKELTVRDALSHAARRLDRDFPRVDEAKAILQDTIGSSIAMLDDLDAGVALLRQAYRSRLALRGPDHPDTAQSAENLATILMLRDELDEVDELLALSLTVHADRFGADHPRTLRSRGNLARLQLQRGEYEAAERSLRDLLRVQRRVLGATHEDTLITLSHLTTLVYERDRPEEAEAFAREELAARQRLAAEDPVALAMTLDTLSTILLDRGELEEARRQKEQALEILQRELGPTHQETLLARGNLGLLLAHEGRISEAVATLREVADLQGASLGMGHAERLATLQNCAVVLSNARRFAEARAAFEEVVDWRRKQSETSRDYVDALQGLQHVLTRLGDAEAAARAQAELERAREQHE